MIFENVETKITQRHEHQHDDDIVTLHVASHQIVMVVDVPRKCLDNNTTFKSVQFDTSGHKKANEGQLCLNGQVLEVNSVTMAVSCGGLLVVAILRDGKQWWMQKHDKLCVTFI